jgi:hypothetical protein
MQGERCRDERERIILNSQLKIYTLKSKIVQKHNNNPNLTLLFFLLFIIIKVLWKSKGLLNY